MVHCEVWDIWTVGLVRLIYLSISPKIILNQCQSIAHTKTINNTGNAFQESANNYNITHTKKAQQIHLWDVLYPTVKSKIYRFLPG